MNREASFWTRVSNYQRTFPKDCKVHIAIIEEFTDLVNADPELKAHRDLCASQVYGFGDRSFHWLWKLLVDELPHEFRFLEIGVYKGQVISLIRLLAQRTGRIGHISGVTPLSNFAGVTGTQPLYPDTDYMMHIKNLHQIFNLPFSEDQIIKGDSTDPQIVERARERGPYDIVYIDGCHEAEFVWKDLVNYTPMIKSHGFLVMDDAANNLDMSGTQFPGIQEVADTLDKWLRQHVEWKDLFAVMHNRVFQAP